MFLTSFLLCEGHDDDDDDAFILACHPPVESFKEIQDSVCVAQRSQDGLEERVVLFLKMVPGVELNKELITSIKNHIRTYLSARHVPSVFLPIGDIPVSTALGGGVIASILNWHLAVQALMFTKSFVTIFDCICFCVQCYCSSS